jgi:hypothetical protein
MHTCHIVGAIRIGYQLMQVKSSIIRHELSGDSVSGE